VGVVLSGVFFAAKVARMVRVVSTLSADEQIRTYIVDGQVFFASAGSFAKEIEVNEPVAEIVIDVSQAHFWDISAIAALDKVVLKARRHGKKICIIGLNETSATMVERFAVHDKENAALPQH
jgi:SulP family sulfate permease